MLNVLLSDRVFQRAIFNMGLGIKFIQAPNPQMKPVIVALLIHTILELTYLKLIPAFIGSVKRW